jgi:hypothetical protein
MATATKQVSPQPAILTAHRRRVRSGGDRVRCVRGNGSYRWTVLGRDVGDGESLARSWPYASHDEAGDAVRVVLGGAGSARFKAGAPVDLPRDLVARSATVARDDRDAEHCLDAGGSVSRVGVTQ